MQPDERAKAILVGAQFYDVSDEEHRSSLDELERLASTMGLEVVARVTQKRAYLSKGTVLGAGKVQALAKMTGGSGEVPSGAKVKKQRGQHVGFPSSGEDEEEEEEPGDDEEGELTETTGEKPKLILVDHDLSPSQVRNLEQATGATVLDRTGVILEIFRRHARTREAKLQVEIARLQYEAPRIRETGGGGDRVRGGVGGRGAGESSLELDRRKIRDRIAELRRELDSIAGESGSRRERRSTQCTVALVGYTNAGKSSLMRRLTGNEVYVADKLFATLDTTVRALHPESRPRILVSDTVGFIKKLPHDLVASFRSTLEEAKEADLLLHVVDASDPAFPQQQVVTQEVLGEIGASQTRLLVLNKIDRVEPAQVEALRAAYPEAFLMSAHRPEDVARLRARIIAHFEVGMIETTLTVPYAEQGKVAQIHAQYRVLRESHDETGTTIVFMAHPDRRSLAEVEASL
ncbi:MAG: GTPase HflX [Deltaproteobacteria bacterium]|nr:GTPase HflX [Deltaproteobacteria bacterium]